MEISSHASDEGLLRELAHLNSCGVVTQHRQCGLATQILERPAQLRKQLANDGANVVLLASHATPKTCVERHVLSQFSIWAAQQLCFCILAGACQVADGECISIVVFRPIELIALAMLLHRVWIHQPVIILRPLLLHIAA